MTRLVALGSGRALLVTGFDGPVDDLEAALARLAADEAPSVAAIGGRCAGPAFELALACDLRIAAASASFSADGVTDVAACARRLARLLGEARAKDVLLTGRVFDAVEALRLGIVTRVVAPARLGDEARGTAERIGAHSPAAVRAARRAIARVRDLSPAQALADEHDQCRRLVLGGASAERQPPTLTGE